MGHAATSPPGDTFAAVEIKPKFYQSSSFFPMPVVLIATTAEDGQTNLGPYSLCFPEPSQGEGAMLLVCRASSKTAANLERTGRATIHFIPDEPQLLANAKTLARAVPTAEKMERSIFTLVDSDAPGAPRLVTEAVQAFECTWDRAHPSAAETERDRHYLLRIDRILIAHRYREALDTGRGIPRLPFDYGFREATSSWLSRPTVRFDGPRLRPRFQLVVPLAADEVLARLREGLDAPGATVTGGIANEHVQINVPAEDRHTWSPQLELGVEEHPDGALLRARLGPHPHVWTMFLAAHAFVGFSALGGVMYGSSQWMIGEPPWALLALPAALILHAFIAGAAFIGQGLGADQTYRLRQFIEDSLAT